MQDTISTLKSNFSQKKVYIIGLGQQGGGVGIARFFSSLGATVTVTDRKNHESLKSSIAKLNGSSIKFLLGSDYLKEITESDLIFKGPSVPWDLPELIFAQKKGIKIEMEISFFAKYCQAKTIGITGTRGKSTTTIMIYEILKKLSGKTVHLGGNIPNISTISLLEKINKDDLVVLELASWPLSGFHKEKISPNIAVFTSFYPDHLNYYKNLDDYFFDKKAIYFYQKNDDWLVANEHLKEKIEEDKINSQVVYYSDDYEDRLEYIKGKHNEENANAALTVASIFKLDTNKAKEIINRFAGLPYRQEVIRELNNVTFINDTTSTTPIATIKAIESFNDAPVILILGNTDKGLPYQDLLVKLSQVEKIILIDGSFTRKILPELKRKYPDKITEIFSDFEAAIKRAYELARSLKVKSYVILSPASASFEMFKNEFDRGEKFNNIVNKLV